MHIIFGSDNAEKLREKYTVLELDTFKLAEKEDHVTAYCVVESIPLEELSESPKTKEMHQQLVDAFKNQNWDECLQSIDKLVGRWGGEVDTYYENLKERVTAFVENEPDENWSHVIPK